MTEKQMRLDQVKHSDTDPILEVWCFTCSLCRAQRRWAYIHESGVILDVAEGETDDVGSIQVDCDGETARNLYLIENSAANLVAGNQAVVHQDIADLHAKAFHDEQSATVGWAH